MRRRRTGALPVLACLAALCTACAGGSDPAPPSSLTTPTARTNSSDGPSDIPSGSSPTAVPPRQGGAATGRVGPQDWPEYHRDAARTGVGPGAPAPKNLRVAWQARLDGAVYGQPLVVRGTVFAATENDTVYALDPATGSVRWSRHVGAPVPRSDLPCGNIDPLGITGTPVWDPSTDRVFVVAETTGGHHRLVGLAAGTGQVQVDVDADPPLGDPRAHQQRGALSLLDARVHVPYGGLAGDCGQYVGQVLSFTTDGEDRRSYAVPTTREGGIWAPGGGVRDGDRLLYAVGNGEATGGSWDGSDSVIALDARMRRVDAFAPTRWAQDNANDLDLGSMTPALVGRWVLAAGKSGDVYVLRADHLGGIGGQVAAAPLCRAFGAPAVDGAVAYLPCADAVAAVRVHPTSGRPTVLWRSDVARRASPVVGGGAVWVADGDRGRLLALDQRDGSVLSQVPVGELPHFASPSLAGGRAFVGTLDGVTAVTGG